MSRYFSEEDVADFQLWNIDVGSALMNIGKKEGNDALYEKGRRTMADLWHFRGVDRSGVDILAEEKTQLENLMGCRGTLRVSQNKNGETEITVNKTGCGCDPDFRAKRVAQLAEAYGKIEQLDAENEHFDIENCDGPFSVGFDSINVKELQGG